MDCGGCWLAQESRDEGVRIKHFSVVITSTLFHLKAIIFRQILFSQQQLQIVKMLKCIKHHFHHSDTFNSNNHTPYICIDIEGRDKGR